MHLNTNGGGKSFRKRGKAVYNSRVREVADNGSFEFADEIAVNGEGRSPFVMGRGWMIERVTIESGEMYFYSDGEPVKPKNSSAFCVFYPPYSIVDLYIRNPRGSVKGFGSIHREDRLPNRPATFETEDPANLETDELFRLVSNGRPIEITTKPSLISLRAKRVIDGEYINDTLIASVADSVGVSHEHLTRQFRADYQLTPSEYLHKLRMAEANYRLVKGDQIAAVSGDVGYNDLSRFYKQFKKQNQTSPGNCRK